MPAYLEDSGFWQGKQGQTTMMKPNKGYLRLRLVFAILAWFAALFPLSAAEYNYGTDWEILTTTDTSGGYDFDSIRSEQIVWEKSTENILSLGFNSRTKWLKVVLHKKKEEKERYYLSFLWPFLDYVAIMGNDGMVQESGDMVRQSNWVRPSIYTVLDISETGRQVFYVKMVFPGLVNFPVRVETEKELFLRVSRIETLELVYSLIIFLVIIYVLSLYARTREKIFLYYLGYITATSFSIFVSYGSAFQYLWPEHPGWQNRAQLAFFAFGTITITNFAYHFLNIRYYLKKMVPAYWFNNALGATVIVLKLTVTSVSVHKLIVFLSLIHYFIFAILVISNAILVYKKKFKPALYFLIIWGVVISCFFLSFLYMTGALPYNFWVVYSGVLALPFDFIVFTAVIIYRLNNVPGVEGLFNQEQIGSKGYKKTYLHNVSVDDVVDSLERLIKEEKIYKNDPEISVLKVAELIGIKPYQLTEVITQKMGRSFAEYLNHSKIEEAVRLMNERKSMRIIDIAHQSGFQSKSAFNTAFKKITGTTPTKYRDDLASRGR